jgi:hypothetical protein
MADENLRKRTLIPTAQEAGVPRIGFQTFRRWPAVPAHVDVIELRALFDIGRNVWVQPYTPRWLTRGHARS